jgi:hypothetical protein
LLKSVVLSAYTAIFKIKVWVPLDYFIEVKAINTGGTDLTVRSTSWGALEVFFIVFLGALALLLYAIALTVIERNIGFK